MMGEKRRRRGKNYYCEPIYKVPDELSLKIVLLAIIALRREWDYKSLERVWTQFVPHPKAYYMMTRYIRSLKASSSVEKPERGKVRITEWGWKKLKYYDMKVGLPDVLREQLKDMLSRVSLDNNSKF